MSTSLHRRLARLEEQAGPTEQEEIVLQIIPPGYPAPPLDEGPKRRRFRDYRGAWEIVVIPPPPPVAVIKAEHESN